MDSFVRRKAKKCVKRVAVDSKSCPDQNKVAEVGPEGYDPFSFRQCTLKIFQ